MMISKKAHVLGAVVLGLIVSLAAIGAVYNQFSPGGALSGTWNSQNVNVAAGTPFVIGTLPAGNGGTGSAFTQFAGPATTVKTLTLPNANATLLSDANAVTFAQGGTGLATAADDTTLISSGSAWVATSVPPCANDGSHALVYDTATNAFACSTLTAGTSSSGTFTATYTTGFTTTPTQNFQWYKVGNIVTISPTSQANGTSNAVSTSTASGSAPAAIRPGGTDIVVTTQATGQNNGSGSSLCMRIASNGTISWGVWSGTGNTPCGFNSWTASGTKLISQADTNTGQGFFTYGVP